MQGWNVLEHGTVKADPGSKHVQTGVGWGGGRLSQLINVSTELTGPGDRPESQDWKKRPPAGSKKNIVPRGPHRLTSSKGHGWSLGKQEERDRVVEVAW